MILLYSGATVANAPQPDTGRSLGGLISNTVVPNSRLNAIFDSISKYALDNAASDTKAVFLTNTTGNTVSTVTIYWNYPDGNQAKLEVAAVTVVNNAMEKINSSKDSPYYANFVQASGSTNKITLTASLANNASIGLWFRRTVLPYTYPTDDVIKAAGINPSPAPTTENIDIHIDWL